MMNNNGIFSDTLSVAQLSFEFKKREKVQKRKITNDDLIKYDRMVHKLINQLLIYYCSTESCVEYQDCFQIGRILVWEALEQFDASRGAKESTFVYLKLWSKFVNLSKKLKIRRQYNVRNLEVEGFESPSLSEGEDTESVLVQLLNAS